MLATSYIKIGIILHIIFSAMMVTNTEIIPSTNPVALKEGESEGDFSFKFRERFWSKPHGTIYALFLIGLLIFVVLKNTIMQVVYSVYKCLFKKDQDEDIFADSTQNDDIYKEFPVEDLSELYEKAQKELKEYQEIKSIDFKRFREMRFEEEQEFT